MPTTEEIRLGTTCPGIPGMFTPVGTCSPSPFPHHPRGRFQALISAPPNQEEALQRAGRPPNTRAVLGRQGHAQDRGMK